MKWTPEAETLLAAEYPTAEDVDALAARLGCTLTALRSRARLLRLQRREPWTDEQKQALCELYGKVSAPEIARRIGRNLSQTYRMADRLDLAFQNRLVMDDETYALIRQRNAEGATDTEIARELGADRHAVSRRRKLLNLPSQEKGRRWRESVARASLRQCAAAGVANLGELRRKAYRDFAVANGWPADLRPRAVQILNLLAAAGVPLSRQQIAEGIGMPWKGPRKSLVSNDPEGTYLSHLAGRGLVSVLPRALQVAGMGKGRSLHLYTLGPSALAILEQRALEESCPNPEPTTR